MSEAAGNYTDGDSFEPRDAVKGDVARMIFYMAVRYEGDDGFADLEPNDKVDNGSAPYIGRLSVLKQWNEQDPPDAFEQHRNDVIYDQTSSTTATRSSTTRSGSTRSGETRHRPSPFAEAAQRGRSPAIATRSATRRCGA